MLKTACGSLQLVRAQRMCLYRHIMPAIARKLYFTSFLVVWHIHLYFRCIMHWLLANNQGMLITAHVSCIFLEISINFRKYFSKLFLTRKEQINTEIQLFQRANSSWLYFSYHSSCELYFGCISWKFSQFHEKYFSNIFRSTFTLKSAD